MSSKKHQKTKFQEYWLHDSVLKLCTEKVPSDNTKAKCIYCNKKVLAENYIEHVTSFSHTSNIPENHNKLISRISEEDGDTLLKSYLNSDIHKKQLELKLMNFIIQNNLSFELGERIGVFFNSLQPHYIQQLKNISINSKKISNMITHCVRPTLEEVVLEDLKTHKFSLLLDFGNDSIGISHLCILARYYKDGVINSGVIKTIEVNESMTGENIFKLVEKNVLNDELISRNLIGFSTDNGPNLCGNGIGFYGQLTRKYPRIFFQSCCCHNYDLIAESVMGVLPERIFNLLRDISKEFAHSNVRKGDFEKIQIELKLSPKTPKKWIESRWLSLGIFL